MPSSTLSSSEAPGRAQALVIRPVKFLQMTSEHDGGPVSREGLTPSQQILAGMLFDMPIIAPVRRRRELPDGTFEFSTVERSTRPIDFAQQGEFVFKLHETDPSAPLSPVYLNLRNLPPEILEQIGIVMAEVVIPDAPDFCAGIPNAGTALAQAYSVHSNILLLDVLEKKEDGTKRTIIPRAGVRGEGKTLRLIDNTATKGYSAIEAIQAAEQLGFKITDVFILVDRQQGAEGLLKSKGHMLRTVLTINQLLQFGLRTGRATQARYAEAVSYLSNN